MIKGIIDPEENRKIIRKSLVFEEQQRELGLLNIWFRYHKIDIIESGTKGKVAVKSHHNVGGLPEDVNFDLVEPLKTLYKEEVREVGRLLGISSEIVDRQPFPGPGLGVRCLGELTKEKLDILREADYIFRDEIKKAGLSIWQHFAVLPNIQSVGVVDGKRTYCHTIALRAVHSTDGSGGGMGKDTMDVLEGSLLELPMRSKKSIGWYWILPATTGHHRMGITPITQSMTI